MKELKIGCGKPTGTKVGEPENEKTAMEEKENNKEVIMASLVLGQRPLILRRLPIRMVSSARSNFRITLANG